MCHTNLFIVATFNSLSDISVAVCCEVMLGMLGSERKGGKSVTL